LVVAAAATARPAADRKKKRRCMSCLLGTFGHAVLPPGAVAARKVDANEFLPSPGSTRRRREGSGNPGAAKEISEQT
jgi:hypothetical protein